MREMEGREGEVSSQIKKKWKVSFFRRDVWHMMNAGVSTIQSFPAPDTSSGNPKSWLRINRTGQRALSSRLGSDKNARPRK